MDRYKDLEATVSDPIFEAEEREPKTENMEDQGEHEREDREDRSKSRFKNDFWVK